WKSAFQETHSSRFASLSYTPHPIATVGCGAYSSPDIGCSDEKNDSVAAYTHALVWALTGDVRYAKKSAEILNGWSSTLTGHTLHNAPLQSGWVGSVFTRAGEILRATYAGWSTADAARFGALLRNVYLPEVVHGSANANGNWELVMAEATMGIGVYLD